MGKKIITSLNEFVMTQPVIKPRETETVPTPTAPPTAPPAPHRPGRPFIPDREPRPDEEERPMAGIMKNIKGSLMKEKGSELAKSLVAKLKVLASEGVTSLA